MTILHSKLLSGGQVARKKSSKKTTKKSAAPVQSRNKMNPSWIIVPVVVVLVIIVGIIISTNKQPTTANNDTVLVTVNGQPITQLALNNQYDRLPANLQATMTKDDVLEQMVDEEVLYQAAEEAGFKAVPADIDNAIEEIKLTNGLTDEDLVTTLESRGSSLEEFRDLYGRQITITNYLNQTILEAVTVSEADEQAYYKNNSAQFQQPEQVTARHILVATSDNVSDTAAMAVIDIIKQKLAEGAGFCELVTEYSDDAGSVANCGEYTFPRGYMVPEFENASFSINVGENAVAKTQFGYHYIEKVSSQPAKTVPFEDVRSAIAEAIKLEKAKGMYAVFLQNIKNKAAITYAGKEDNTLSTEAKLATCLADNGAYFYGASWCSHCNSQKELFGEAAKDLPYVECSTPENPNAQAQACKDAGITGYPTWVFKDGTRVSGEQSFAQLAKLSGCTI
ncbi:MAG: peptidylprolyl isomerase [Candidatus Woesearchaeota archaeon]